MKNNTSSLTKKDIAHLANLSQLSLTEDEKAKIGDQLNETLQYVANLDDLDTSTVHAASHVSGKTNTFREDVIDRSLMLTQEQALSNAKKKKNGYFVVEKIL